MANLFTYIFTLLYTVYLGLQSRDFHSSLSQSVKCVPDRLVCVFVSAFLAGSGKEEL
jgi:hypothetical protein